MSSHNTKSSMNKKAAGTQAHGKPHKKHKPCPRPCNQVPINVPSPAAAKVVLHPKKDVFVLKVAKVGPNGDRRCKMELELVTPPGPQEKGKLTRIDTRETQCDPEPPLCACCCGGYVPKKKK